MNWAARLFSLCDEGNYTPSLSLGERTGFHNADLIADAALVVLVMSVNLESVLNDLTVDGVLYVVRNSNGNGLVHLVAYNKSDSYFSEVSVFHFLLPPYAFFSF